MDFTILDVTNNIQDPLLISKSRNIYKVIFSLEDEWEGFTKMAVFKNSSTVKEVFLSDNQCIIPWEVLDNSGNLFIGIYGIKEDMRKSTVYTYAKYVREGAEDGTEPQEPTKDVYESFLEEINDISNKVDKLYEDAENGVFNGKSAYEYAVENGYKGTEEEFGQKLVEEHSLTLPTVTEEDNGKVLLVDGGKWVAKELPAYEGAYEITPKTSTQTLDTAQKFMSEDVTVNAIPFYETSNTSGGNTVYIGKELE